MREHPGVRSAFIAASKTDQAFVRSFDTPYGPMAVVWSVPGARPLVLQIFLSRPGLDGPDMARAVFQSARTSFCPEIGKLGNAINAFLSGEDVRFNLDDVRMDLVGDFQRRVLLAEHGIPRGHASTYGRIAARVGVPGGARAAGSALANNPFPIVVPCHRAVRSDGSLGGYQGGLDMKKALLRMEGVPFSEADRVEESCLYY